MTATGITQEEIAAAFPVEARINPLYYKLRPGTRIDIRYTATVIESNAEDGRLLLQRDKAREVLLVEYVDLVDLAILPPDVVPGCVMSAGGSLWSIRKSNNKDSLRVCPVDLSGKLRTTPIEEFISRYPTAKVLFDPRNTA